MIRYALRCDQSHQFESWFQSAAAFDALRAAGQVDCPVCGSHAITKDLMTPAVKPGRTGTQAGALSAPASPAEEALAAMRRHIEETSDYVGLNFTAEARAIHAGEAPERAIHGEAKPEEARALLEDGIPVTPLPFLPPRKVN